MKTNYRWLAVLLFAAACGRPPQESTVMEKNDSTSFQSDVDFLTKYTEIIVLSDPKGKGRVAVSPALQGRVMTSSADGMNGDSYGWINRPLFESGDTSIHINAFGGEERFWIGPEGGQFSVFFEKGKEFNLENWKTPRLIDLEPFELVSNTDDTAVFTKSAEITNYSGTVFNIRINREINVLAPSVAYLALGIPAEPDVKVVAYQTRNSIENTGEPWSKKTGILSIWLLGMFKPSDETIIDVPFTRGDEKMLGPIVNDSYFGKVPGDRLSVNLDNLIFIGDGKYRSKIGLSPLRCKDHLASYDTRRNILTIVKFDKPVGVTDYVNSAWEIQEHPFKGDVINAYNDGPPSPGAKPLGPFYELESSSPALELKKGEKVTHNQTTFHFQGSAEAMERLLMATMYLKIER